MITGYRKTTQHLLPSKKGPGDKDEYDIYPALKISDGKIFSGFDSLAELLVKNKIVVIEGYGGVFFSHFRKELDCRLKKKGIKVSWISTEEFFKPQEQIDVLIAPYTGGNDPLFGRRCDLALHDFFEPSALQTIGHVPDSDMTIFMGIGASLVRKDGLLIYIDLPKNELQFRARAGSITNLGSRKPFDPKAMYKRSYFVDWVVLNRHKQKLIPRIDLYIDGQHPEDPAWIKGGDLREALHIMSRNVLRVRPWFEPGPWGGTWIKDHISGLNNEVPNYAWSFELITPENGLLIESSSLLLEVSFDCLMFMEAEAVLGDCHKRFGTEFPVRFDFLDTFDGGNLSIQCHPRPEYINKYFGENLTQEETYYILDTKNSAVVYLGFTQEADPELFRSELQKSFENKTPFDADRFIMKHASSKHDLFLIPYGTIHGSGKDNLVLEISSTPYIFTFKMYDWLRKDLEGRLRDLNITRAMENLFFDRKGNYVTEKLKSKPEIISRGDDWELWHLPTHETHLYDVHRYNFGGSIDLNTDNKCLVMSLVEGKSIRVDTENGLSQEFSYAETFIIPAAARKVRITNLSSENAMLVKAFVK